MSCAGRCPGAAKSASFLRPAKILLNGDRKVRRPWPQLTARDSMILMKINTPIEIVEN